MQLSETDAVYAASKFINYFSNTGRIDEYLRTIKLDRIADQPQSLFGMRPEDDLFSDFDMHPQDMDIKIYPAGQKDRTNSFQNEYFNERLQITMSHAFEMCCCFCLQIMEATIAKGPERELRTKSKLSMLNLDGQKCRSTYGPMLFSVG